MNKSVCVLIKRFKWNIVNKSVAEFDEKRPKANSILDVG